MIKSQVSDTFLASNVPNNYHSFGPAEPRIIDTLAKFDDLNKGQTPYHPSLYSSPFSYLLFNDIRYVQIRVAQGHETQDI